MIAPTKIYEYTPTMSPAKAVSWMLDVIITRNKRKVGPMGLAALSMYYLLPKTSESIVNLGYQVVYEQPPVKAVSTVTTGDAAKSMENATGATPIKRKANAQ